MVNYILSLDTSIEQALYVARDPFLVQAFTWITWLGEVFVVLGLTAAVAIVLAYRKQWAPMAGIITSVIGSAAVTYILKELVARPRPPMGIPTHLETGFSFPSGHATFVIAFYGFMLYLMWEKLTPMQRKIKTVAVGIIVLAVGFSRLYLGVHYPTDVLAGFLAGGVFVWLGILISRRFSPSKSS